MQKPTNMPPKTSGELDIRGTFVRVAKVGDEDYICLTDMLKAKDGELFITDRLRLMPPQEKGILPPERSAMVANQTQQEPQKGIGFSFSLQDAVSE